MANVKVGLYVRLHAKPGKESELQQLLTSAVALANQEAGTTVWFAIKYDKATFAIFDAFPDESGRRAHLAGAVAEQLKARAPELFSRAPAIDQADVIAAKLPH